MALPYLNALEVLPREVYLVVAKAIGGVGALLYVPGVRQLGVEERNRRILEMYVQGSRIHEIADEVFVHVTTVRRIVRKARAAGNLLLPVRGPGTGPE